MGMALRAALLLLVVARLWMGGAAQAEVIGVPSTDDQSQPTQTFLWQGKDARAVLIMLPGGEGRLGLKPGMANIGGFYGAVLRPLSDPALTSGSTHVVVFDSPYPLAVGDFYPLSRAQSDHLERIESVVRFYQDRFALPVWLMGHSNGAISVAEFIRVRPELVAGAIFSASRVGVKLPDRIAFPILFMHHKYDACSKANPSTDVALYDRLRASGKTDVAFQWIEGGASENRYPCQSGHHMYFGSESAATAAIAGFMANY